MQYMWKTVAVVVLSSLLLSGEAIPRPHTGATFPPGVRHEIPTQKHIAISGIYMSALNVAYSDWSRRVSAGRYAIRNQTIIVSPQGRDISIVFIPRNDDPTLLGGETPYGKDTTYLIDASGKRILSRLFGE
jgi:hypothetical protein